MTVYRLTGLSFIDFLIGTFVLASVALLVGEFTISLAYLANRKKIGEINDEVIQYQNISVDAVKAGDKKSYTAANKIANDAFGRSFFFQIALSTGFLWPIPFALGWMQYRFGEVELPFVYQDVTVGYFAVFIALFAAAYLIFRRLKRHLPYFARIHAMLEEDGARSAEMKSFADLLPQSK